MRKTNNRLLLVVLGLTATILSSAHGNTQKGSPPSPCPPGPWQQTGRLPVTHCNATNDGLHDTLSAFQLCAQLAAACRAVLVVPPGKYWLNGTLQLSITSLPSRGGSLRVEGINSAQLCRCHGCIDSRCDGRSPTVLVGDFNKDQVSRGFTDGVVFSNLYISGTATAVHVVNAAGFRMQVILVMMMISCKLY